MIEYNLYLSWVKIGFTIFVGVGALALLVWVLTKPMWTIRDNRATVLPPDETFRAPRLRTVSSPPVAYPTEVAGGGLTNDPIATATLLGMGFSPAPQVHMTTDISSKQWKSDEDDRGGHTHAVTPAEVHAPASTHTHVIHTQAAHTSHDSPVSHSHDSHASHTTYDSSSSSSYDSGSCSYDSGSSSSSFD